MRLRRIRPIYWGLVLTFAGIFSTFILCYVLSWYGNYIVTGPPFESHKVTVAPFYLTYGVMFTICLMLFSLPLAIAIEAYRYLKGRKSEAKEREYR